MKFGVVFPQAEIGVDPIAIRDFAQAVESLGYDHLMAHEHVLGANAVSRPGWRGAYQHTDAFHEPFVLFGFLAGATERIELATGIVILPQRQTVLVAKQAAALDVLSGGRLRLGIGIGWNDVEFEALGENFHDRGRRSEEQVQVMRALWTQELVTFEGRWHKITDAGLNPLPVQRPIPLWFGGTADPVLRRIARMGDGWTTTWRPDERGRAAVDKLRSYVRQEGRELTDVGVESWVAIANRTPEEWVEEVTGWTEIGATHLCVNTLKAGLSSPDGHIEALRRFREATKGL